MSLIMGLIAVGIFSVLSFWKLNYILSCPLFMITAGMALMLGLQWFDIYTTDSGLSYSLMLIAYSIACLGFAFRSIFWGEQRGE